jgi:hypothetical protein
MTRFAEKAIDSAIRLSLHKQERKDGDLIVEAKSRAWWMTVSSDFELYRRATNYRTLSISACATHLP